MHASLKRELPKENATYAFEVEYELSASDQEKNPLKTTSTEIHYVYVKENKTMIDIAVDSTQFDENVKSMINSMVY
ncbi:hypothetical protein P261_02078 [Lachnospiraceae bacterium TWA4]|nr:hypothetical protein P261_02078 [Lachnospiraceae bacterium TWA4]